MNNINVAFHAQGIEGWTVGPVYLRNLFYALRQSCGKELGIYILAASRQQGVQSYSRSVGTDNIIRFDSPRQWTPFWGINGLIKRLFSYDMSMERILKKHGIDVVFGPSLFYRYKKIATLSWIADFQHIHLPDMFSKSQRLSLDAEILRSNRIVDRIILLSDTVKEDFRRLCPMYVDKTRVLRPVCSVAQDIYNHDLGKIRRLYNLPEKFVYLPNQFYKHKNHEMAFRALKILKDRGIRLTLVCSGRPNDHRHPNYFAELLQKLSIWDIRDSVIYLGMIPYEHVLLLMRQSVCVMSASLFEGWGYTIEESRAVGKQALLSDIPVYREQNPPKATFFKPDDCEELAENLARIWLKTPPGPDGELETEARRIQPQRIREYAETFVSVVREAV